MKKILYFLLGFTFVLSFATFCYAQDYVDLDCIKQNTSFTDNYNIIGWAESSASADAMLSGVSGTGPYGMSFTLDKACFSVYEGATGPVGCSFRKINSSPLPTVVGYSPAAIEAPTDNDDDGIPNEYDLYPDDPTTYKFSILGCVENSTTGEKVQCLVKTDRGDVFAFGSRPADMTGYIDTVNANPMLIDGADAEALFATQTATNTTTVDNSALYDTITDTLVGSGDADQDTGSGFTPGESVAGTESDSELLEKIAKNTTTQNTNTTRLGDYLKEINSTLKNIDLKQTLVGSGAIAITTNGTTTGTTTETTTTATDVQAGVEAALTPGVDDVSDATTAGGNTDSAFAEAQDTITGTASLDDDAPAEYKEKTDIGGYLDDLLENSPFMNLITGTGVTTSGSNPTLTYSYKGHPITLTVAGFETELNAFGVILIAITTLSGMLMIFRG